jgi:hypothetical protein
MLRAVDVAHMAEPARNENRGAAAGAGHVPGQRATPTTAVASPLLAIGATALPILELQRAAGNRAVAWAIGRAGAQRSPVDPVAPPPKPTEPHDQVVGQGAAGATANPAPKKVTGYLGMNPAAKKEIGALEKAAGKDSVLATTGDAALEAKLKEEPAIADFVFDDLGISPAKVTRWEKAIDALVEVGPRSRDTLGELMRWMNRAEDGEIVLDRLVLSGHSNGFELWGDPESPNAAQKPGVLVVERDLANVAAAFPTAAGQVRSIMFSACETVGAVESVVRIFPNVESVWAYAGFSPSVAQGSGQHIEAWERATEGGGTPTRKDARGATAIWTRQDKWLVRDPGKGNIATLYTQAMSEFHGPVGSMLRGQRAIAAGELRSIYNRVQAVVRHPALATDRKATAKQAMEVILRLRHWDEIRAHFAAERGPGLVEHYRTLEIAPPNWAALSRAELVTHLRALGRAYEKREDATTAKGKIEEQVYLGLYQLDPTIIPAEWNAAIASEGGEASPQGRPAERE